MIRWSLSFGTPDALSRTNGMGNLNWEWETEMTPDAEIKRLTADNERMLAALNLDVVELTELLRFKMCGPRQECDAALPCTCRDSAQAIIELLRSRSGNDPER